MLGAEAAGLGAEERLSRRKLGMQIGARFVRHRKGHGREYLGVGLRADAQDAPGDDASCSVPVGTKLGEEAFHNRAAVFADSHKDIYGSLLYLWLKGGWVGRL